MASRLDAGVAVLAAVSARRREALELVSTGPSWWWLVGSLRSGDGIFNKRGGGSDPCRSATPGGHGGESEAVSSGSGALRAGVCAGLLRWWFVVLMQVLGLLAARSGPVHVGRLGGDLHGVVSELGPCWHDDAISDGLDGGGAVAVPLAGRGGEEGDGEGAAGIGLSWWGVVEDGQCLRLPLLMVTATTRWWWLGRSEERRVGKECLL